MKRLAVVTTHPIQYNAPVFKLLATDPRLHLKVFYTLGKPSEEVVDKGFGKKIAWDIPLLEGYEYEFIENISKNPSTSYYKGVINPTIIQDIDSFNPTDILVFGWRFDSHLKILKYYKNKINVFFRGDSTLLDEKKGIRLIMRRLLLFWTYTYIDKAFYVGTNNKEYFLKHGVKEQNLIFAPHAIDNDRFGNDALYSEKSKLLRQELGIPKNHLVFLFAGKFEKKKNPLLLIQAFKQLNQPNTSLLLVGNGVLESEMHKEAAGNNYIHFLPFQNQTYIPTVYRAANVLVLPSSGPGETWGLCINEAMASGLAIIASNKVGCAVDLVNNSVNGYTFEHGNSFDLTSKLSVCMDNDITKMGSNSKSIISKWSYNQLLTAIINAIVKD